MMGYLGAEAAVMYGTVPDDFLMDNVQCGGGEESLLHCSHVTQDNCGTSEGAGAICR